MRLKSSYANGDVWLKPETKTDRKEHCEYIMCYVDDILAVSIDPWAVLNETKGGNIKFKNDKIELPEIYLGARLEEKTLGEIEC